MTDKEPTKEQKSIPLDKEIKKLWEWCGFHRREPNISFDWWSPDNHHWGSNLPVLDLNNLFKYAMPDTIQVLIHRNEDWTKERALGYLFQAWLLEYKEQGITFEDALFWVIWEVIKK